MRGVWIIGVVMGCTPPSVTGGPLNAPNPGEVFEGVQCSSVRPKTEPDLMAWDPVSRANLDRLRRSGIVAVRYVATGCNVELELISHCIGKGEYRFSPYSANLHKTARNANELFAELPVGAAKLAGKLKGSRSLRTDYMLAGSFALPASADAPTLAGPECGRATHVVTAIYVGGFAMAAGEDRVMEATASFFGAGGSATGKAGVESIADEGNADACKNAQREEKASESCSVPLRIALLAIGKPASTPAPPPPPPTLGTEVSEEKPGNADALFAEGRRHYQGGRYAEACQAFARSLQLEDAAGTRFNLGACHEKQGKKGEACAHYKKAEELSMREGHHERVRVVHEKLQRLCNE